MQVNSSISVPCSDVIYGMVFECGLCGAYIRAEEGDYDLCGSIICENCAEAKPHRLLTGAE